jgi:hypothetical protein
MATFPAPPILSQGESPSLYKVETNDKSVSAETDGGYEFRRRRFTRRRRRQYETGFLFLPHADYVILDEFWEEHQTDTPFTWHDPIQGVDRTVRFDEFKPDYVGIGQYRLWTIKIKISEI